MSIYRYDAFNRLTKYNSGSAEASYTYNANNLRASKTVNRETTSFVWNGQNLAAENKDGSTNTYTYDITGVHIANRNGNVTSYLKDYHGNIVGTTTVAGAMVEEKTGQMDYDAFGNRWQGDTPDPFGYCGEYLDNESGLIYLRNRYYDSKMGRFITEDPIKDGLTWYVYCGNEPIMLVDPSGLIPTEREAAEMAQHIYSYDMDSDIEERRVAGWRLIDVWYGQESMKMGIYIRDDDDWENPSEYAVVFQGTPITSITAWKNNIEQGVGNTSADTWDAVNYAAGFVKTNPDKEITFVGHSKGGQEARSAALKTNKNAIVFNPAAVNMSAYGLSADYYTADMKSFIVNGDILDNLNKGFVKINKNLKIIPAGQRIDLPQSSKNPIQCHTMDAVINGLIKLGY